MIRLILLTGFLGAGKTTLLQRLLDAYKDTPMGLIVNEFGEINIDARLLERDRVATKELSNGSIFCACIKENFIKALIELSSHPIESLFIEASGLADPSNMQQILETIGPRLAQPYRYEGSVCVLDGEAFLELIALLPAVRNQLSYAGAVLVNKEDLISAETRSKIEDEIRSANPAAPVYFTRYCEIDLEQLIRCLQAPQIESKNSTNTPETRPQTFVVHLQPSLTLEELRAFLHYIAPFTYRVKGFAQIGDARYSVSCVRAHVMIMPWPGEIPASELVLISAVGIGLTGALGHGIKTFAPASMRI